MAGDIINIEPHITLKEAVQRRLAAELDKDAGLRARLEADPGAVIKPIIAELLGDDGGVDLSTITTSVHVESDTHLHFVVTPGGAQSDLDEVSGFSIPGVSGMLSGLTIGLDTFEGSGIKYDPSTRRLCSTDSPDATTHRHCSTKAKHCTRI